MTVCASSIARTAMDMSKCTRGDGSSRRVAKACVTAGGSDVGKARGVVAWRSLALVCACTARDMGDTATAVGVAATPAPRA